MLVFSADKFLSRLEQGHSKISEAEFKEFCEPVLVNCDKKEARRAPGHDVAFVTGADGQRYIVAIADCEYI